MRDEKGRFIKGHGPSNTGRTRFKKGVLVWNKGLTVNDDPRVARSIQAAHSVPHPKGEEHPLWKGEGVTYRTLHKWVENSLGKPNKCERCETEEPKFYYWHNISGEYYRDLEDWVRLCSTCHGKIHSKVGAI